MVKKDGIQKINKICENVLNLTDDDFKQVREMAHEQSNYMHPLKNATAAHQHKLGDQNIRVLNALHVLRETIKAGADI